MKISLLARSILATITLAIVGCDPAEPPSEGPPKIEEHSESKLGPPSPEPPVTPSPVPTLPESQKAAVQAIEAEKKAEAKPAEKKDEPPK